MVKNLSANAGDMGSIPRSRGSPREEMATHSSILAWEIPWAEEPGGLQSMGSAKRQIGLSDEACTHTRIHRKVVYERFLSAI